MYTCVAYRSLYQTLSSLDHATRFGIMAVPVVAPPWLLLVDSKPQAAVSPPAFHCFDNQLPHAHLPLIDNRQAAKKWLCPYRLQLLAAADPTFKDRLDGVKPKQ